MTTIVTELWGQSPEGKDIMRFTLRNERGTELQLTNVGAAMVAVRVADRNGKVDDVLLGYRDGASYIGDCATCGKCVGRVANRITDGRMVVEGKTYELEINNAPNHLHGGSQGYANLLWGWRVEGEAVIFTMHSPDGDQGYPGCVDLEVRYTLDEENRIALLITGECDATTPLMITNHAYWNLSGEASGTILDHELRLNCSTAEELNLCHVPTGRIIDVVGTPQDFRTAWRRFGDEIDSDFQNMRTKGGYGVYYPLDDYRRGELQEVGELRDPASGRRLRIYTTQRGVMLYTGNKLSIACPETKSGGTYCNYAGVALECQAFVDAVNFSQFQDIMLHKGETYSEQIVYQLLA